MVLLFITFYGETEAVCSPLYGGEPCLFVPAPPGKTPSCARPGLTYCEHSPHYPKELIKHLIALWRYDKRTLFLDETPDEFNSYYVHPYASESYSPRPFPSYGVHNYLPPENHIPEPIYIPKPPYTPSYNPFSNTYIPPPLERNRSFSDFVGYPDRRPYNQEQELSTNQLYNYKPFYKPPEDYNQQRYYNHLNALQNSFIHPPSYHFFPNSKDWWQRPARDIQNHQRHLVKKRNQRSLNIRKQLREIASTTSSSNFTTSAHVRRKRQNNPNSQSLCEARTQFVMPEAAMNSQGNWMYVVNVQDGNSKYTQLVRTETCTSQQCSGLCGLPTGYTSRCEQKYIQKRLVALEGTGNNLYTDLFWIPSCCVCMLAQG